MHVGMYMYTYPPLCGHSLCPLLISCRHILQPSSLSRSCARLHFQIYSLSYNPFRYPAKPEPGNRQTG